MGKEQIQAEYLEAFNANRMISKYWISIVRVAGLLCFIGSLIGMIASLGAGFGPEPGTGAQLITFAGSVVSLFQAAVFFLLAEIATVAMDNSRILRRIAAGVIRPAS
ncbi:hypothetical protein ACQKH5_16680 [Hyphomonas sp. NPDC076900]|uniref:hypothetical protein n=1 Tax=unclassified Hyphomonas TaxID=2630699 RepID=UPI003D069B05